MTEPPSQIETNIRTGIVRLRDASGLISLRVSPVGVRIAHIRYEAQSAESPPVCVAQRVGEHIRLSVSLHGNEQTPWRSRRCAAFEAAARAWFGAVGVESPPEGKWYVTAHAVDRYRKRFEPSITQEEARVDLEWASVYAVDVGITYNGSRLYENPYAPRVGYVVSDDDRVGMPALVTVNSLDVAKRSLLRNAQKK